jgi:hypothetical protein
VQEAYSKINKEAVKISRIAAHALLLARSTLSLGYLYEIFMLVPIYSNWSGDEFQLLPVTIHHPEA